MALLGGIGELGKALANPVQDAVIGGITDIQRDEALIVEFRAAQNFLE